MNDRSLNSLSLDAGSALTLSDAETLVIGDVLEQEFADIYDLCLAIQAQLTELKAYGDANWKTATGFATSEALAEAKTSVGEAVQTLATSSEVEAAKEAIISSIDEIPETDLSAVAKSSELEELAKEATVKTLATSAELTSAKKAIVSSIEAIPETDLSSLATSSELAALAAGRTLADLATAEDLTSAKKAILSSIEAIPETDLTGLAKTTDLSTLATSKDLANVKTSVDSISTDISYLAKEATVKTLATSSELYTAQTSIISSINAIPKTDLTDVAKSSELEELAKTTDLSTLAKTTDLSTLAKSSELEELAKSSDLEGLAEKTDLTGLAKTTDLSTLATSDALAEVKTSVDAIPTDISHLAKEETVQTLATSSELSVLAKEATLNSAVTAINGVPSAVWSYGDGYVDRVVKANGVQIEGTVSASVDSDEIATKVWGCSPTAVSSDTMGATVTSTLSGLSSLAKSSELSSLAKEDTVQTLATSADVTSAETSILSSIAAIPKTDLSDVAKSSELLGLAKTTDLDALATSDALAEVKTSVDAIPTDISHLAKEATLNSAVTTISGVPSAVWSYGDGYADRVVKANGVSLDGSELAVTVDSTAIAQAVWSNDDRTLTTQEISLDGLATSDEVEEVGASLTSIRDEIMAYFTRVLSSQQLQVGLLGHWKLEENTLQVFDENGYSLSEISLTKDRRGNIIQMGAVAGDEDDPW